MDFEPLTNLYFAKTGVDDFNKVVCKTEIELVNLVLNNERRQGSMTFTSFQRADNYWIVRVDHADVPYYKLLNSDTILYHNNMTENSFWIWCNILGVDWKNPDCSFVRFKIDYFMTYQYMIDWEHAYAFVEREHIKEDWSPSGNPMFSNMGPAESFGTVADTPFYTFVAHFNPNGAVIYSPYDDSGEAVFDGDMKGNVYSGLQVKVGDAGKTNEYLKAIAEKKTASINNIVGVYTIPMDWEPILKSGGVLPSEDGQQHNIPAVNKAGEALPSFASFKYNNAKCWSSPFVKIRLMSSEGETVDFNPQWLGNDQDEYTVKFRWMGAGGMFAGAQATLFLKNGAFNWKAWNDFIVSIKELPASPWTGDGFTDWRARNESAAQFNAFSSAINGFLGAIGSLGKYMAGGTQNPTGGAIDVGTQTVNAAFNAIGQAVNYDAMIANQEATGSTVRGGGHFNNLGDVATNAWGFKVIYYGTQIYTMQSVDAYFDRFGYRVNKLKKLELENRPIWTFIKTIECHVPSTVGIPYVAEQAINSMFNSGVTMWKLDKYTAGRQIGDFSNAKENRSDAG